MTRIHIYTDGGSRGNPGPAASAYLAVVKDNGRERTIRKESRRIGRATNNQAEYRAMIMALEWARSRGFSDLHLHSDSQLMVKQIRGDYRVKSLNVKGLYGKLMELVGGTKYRISHHPREERHIKVCDSMVNRELDG